MCRMKTELFSVPDARSSLSLLGSALPACPPSLRTALLDGSPLPATHMHTFDLREKSWLSWTCSSRRYRGIFPSRERLGQMTERLFSPQILIYIFPLQVCEIGLQGSSSLLMRGQENDCFKLYSGGSSLPLDKPLFSSFSWSSKSFEVYLEIDPNRSGQLKVQ